MVEPPRDEAPMQLIVIGEILPEGDTSIALDVVLRMVTVVVTQLVEVYPTSEEDQTAEATTSLAIEEEETEELAANLMELQLM